MTKLTAKPALLLFRLATEQLVMALFPAMTAREAALRAKQIQAAVLKSLLEPSQP